MTKNVRDFTRSVYLMDAVVRRVPNNAWMLSSPCEGWTARDVVGHVASVLTAAAEMVVTGVMVMPEMPADLADPDLVWSRAREAILGAIDEPGALEREGAFWFGPMSVDDLIGVVLWDPLTHAWDVATAVGIDPHLDEDLARRRVRSDLVDARWARGYGSSRTRVAGARRCVRHRPLPRFGRTGLRGLPIGHRVAGFGAGAGCSGSLPMWEWRSRSSARSAARTPTACRSPCPASGSAACWRCWP